MICIEITTPSWRTPFTQRHTSRGKARQPRRHVCQEPAHTKLARAQLFLCQLSESPAARQQQAAAGHIWGLFHMSTMEMSWAPKVSYRHDTERCSPVRLRHTPQIFRLLLVWVQSNFQELKEETSKLSRKTAGWQFERRRAEAGLYSLLESCSGQSSQEATTTAHWGTPPCTKLCNFALCRVPQYSAYNSSTPLHTGAVEMLGQLSS